MDAEKISWMTENLQMVNILGVIPEDAKEAVKVEVERIAHQKCVENGRRIVRMEWKGNHIIFQHKAVWVIPGID